MKDTEFVQLEMIKQRGSNMPPFICQICDVTWVVFSRTLDLTAKEEMLLKPDLFRS